MSAPTIDELLPEGAATAARENSRKVLTELLDRERESLAKAKILAESAELVVPQRAPEALGPLVRVSAEVSTLPRDVREVTSLAKHGCRVCAGSGLVTAQKNAPPDGAGRARLAERQRDFCRCALKRWLKARAREATEAQKMVDELARAAAAGVER